MKGLNKQEQIKYQILLTCFLIIQTINYIISTFKIELSFIEGSYVFAFLFIFLDLFFAIILILFFERLRNLSTFLLVLGLFFTMIADIFLIICDERFVEGLICFSLVQITYLIKLLLEKNDKSLTIKYFIVLVLILFVAQIVAYLIFRDYYDIIILIAVLYGTLFIGNIVLTSMKFIKNILFSIGMILYFLCDICVAMDYLSSNGFSFFAFINQLPINLIFFFYLPGQILITFSIYKKNLS